MTEKQLILKAIAEFHFKGRTNEQIAKVLHLPLVEVQEEVKNIVFSPGYYGGR
jgi:hypothetical protein